VAKPLIQASPPPAGKSDNRFGMSGISTVRTYKIDSWSAANEVITRQAYGVFPFSACAKGLHRLEV
jgi:hypothetical protein